jgi:hypothetical protein
MDNEKPVGRIAVYFNPALYYNGKISACAGNYECIDDISASAQLLAHVEEVARKNSYQYLIGPMNGSTWDNYRFSKHYSNKLFLSETYHHLYYNDHFSSSGFRTVSKYISRIDRMMTYTSAELETRGKELIEQGVTFRNIKLNDYETELKKIYEFSLRAFSNNFLYTPVSERAFIAKYMQVMPIIDPEFVIIAEDEGSIAGLVFCFPDLYSEEKHLILKTVARSISPVYKGLGNILSSKVTGMAKEKGFEAVIHAFMIEDNFSAKLSGEYSREPYSEYMLYGKEI